MDIMKYVWCFIIGGAICIIGQILIDKTKLTSARILVLFVTAGAILTGLGIYEPVVKLGRCRCYCTFNRIWLYTC